MELVPMEILELILSNPVLSIRDVINFSTTCHYYRELVVFNNSLWKQKFKSEWPEILGMLDNDSPDYYKEIIYIHQLYKYIEQKLELMPSKFCKKYEISECELEEWTLLLSEKRENYYYLVDYLMKIVNSTEEINSVDVVPLNTPGNKTQQYYAGKVLRHIRQVYLSKEWTVFKSLNRREQLLEDGAIFVAQWCQPHLEISRKTICPKLDKIANAVKRKLKIVYPNHRIFNVTQEVLEKWRKYNLESHQWTTPECQQIMQVLKEVLFEDMRFKGNNIAYYMPQNSYINEVLDFKQGLPITLSIIYEAVARRLGIFCQPINFPSHFLLRYSENGQDWYLLDVYNGGKIIKRPTGNHDLNNLMTSPVEVVERMANNLEVSARQHTQVNGRVTRLRSSLELLKLVNPRDISSLVSLSRLYMLHSMDTRSLETFLLGEGFQGSQQAQRLVHMLRNHESHPSRSRNEQTGPVVPEERTPELKFAVGMIMTHLALDYKCVIYDWDKECKASVDWQEQMHVDLLRYGNKQPFYNVLVEDGSHRYVAQENLQPTCETGFLYLNEDIGRYFSHHYKTHYVPNANKESEYPYDKELRLRYHDGFMNMQMET
ncbi:F-box only protein 21-like isoform X2 [Coccinella septempunctata]|uniref:F-box only protein 21-like isoform X2 n=1 Tax=Coccinella septempunctata TaxID=41139 RepID=UPI001D07CC3A|nr:F-box only protein 21-like isoform X2 [Coccinella septempunctata]